MRQLGYIESDAPKKPITFYMDKKSPSKGILQFDQKEESDNIEELKKQLQNMYLLEQYYLTLIETAEEELKINIRKKSYTK